MNFDSVTKYSEEELENFYFFKDDLFYKMFNKLNESVYVKDPYFCAKNLRVMLSQNVFIQSLDIDDALICTQNIKELYVLTEKDQRSRFKDYFNERFSKMLEQLYKDRLIELFLENYSKNADRFNSYEIDKLHRSFGHIYVINKYQNQRLNNNYKNISLDTFIKSIKENGNKINLEMNFDLKKYDSVRYLDCSDVFEIIVHRIDVICWLREAMSNINGFEGKTILLANRLNDIGNFFYDLIDNPISARYKRLVDLPYWYENPLGNDKSKFKDRINKQPHVFNYKFFLDCMNDNLAKKGATQANKSDYPELYESDGTKPSILTQGGKFLEGMFIPLLDIMLLSEFYGYKVTHNSIAKGFKFHDDTAKITKLFKEVEKRFNTRYLEKLGSLYKFQKFNKKITNDTSKEIHR